jgi:hypothetical protein
MSTTTPVKSPENNELYAERGLLRQLAGAFNEGSLDSLNAQLHSLCGPLACSTPGHAADIGSSLAEGARESLEASIAARASLA